MTACIVGWAHSRFGKLEGETLESLITRVSVEALEHALGRKAILDLRPAQPGDVERTFADISRARRELCWEPTTSLQEGLARFVGWLRDYRDLYRDPAESAATG